MESAAPAPARKISGKVIIVTALFLGLVLGLLAFLGFGLKSRPGLFRLYHLRQERDRLEQLNRRLKEENEKLARTIERLQGDREMIEDLIRRELNFVKENDLIFQMPQEKGPAVAPPPKSSTAGASHKPAAAPGKTTKSGKSPHKATKSAKQQHPPAKAAKAAAAPIPEKKP